MPKLNLIVLRARDAGRLASFYSALGLRFVEHRHGTGPLHYAAEDEGAVFEIYNAPDEQRSTRELRLGFSVVNVRETVERLTGSGASLVRQPSVSPWGLRAVVKDVEGHVVELVETGAP